MNQLLLFLKNVFPHFFYTHTHPPDPLVSFLASRSHNMSPAVSCKLSHFKSDTDLPQITCSCRSWQVGCISAIVCSRNRMHLVPISSFIFIFYNAGRPSTISNSHEETTCKSLPKYFCRPLHCFSSPIYCLCSLCILSYLREKGIR